MPHTMTPERLTAQIACEAIINHEHDGYTLRDMAHVYEVATREGVGDLYRSMLLECIERAVREAREGLGL